MNNWKKSIAFHGHGCGGLAIGVRAAEAAIKEMNISFSEDEELVCVAENNSCSIDAIQALLGCTAGKGNLIIDNNHKQVFSLFDRKSGKAVRLCFKAVSNGRPREEWMSYILNAPLADLFKVSKPTVKLPEYAQIHPSVPCGTCGELTAEPALTNGVCRECAGE